VCRWGLRGLWWGWVGHQESRREGEGWGEFAGAPLCSRLRGSLWGRSHCLMSMLLGLCLCLVRECPVGAVGWGGLGWVGRVAGVGGSLWVGGVGGEAGGPWGCMLPEDCWWGPWWGVLFVAFFVGGPGGGPGCSVCFNVGGSVVGGGGSCGVMCGFPCGVLLWGPGYRRNVPFEAWVG
jgi:hypothetical protein